jgi:hypothetical protein
MIKSSIISIRILYERLTCMVLNGETCRIAACNVEEKKPHRKTHGRLKDIKSVRYLAP